MKLISISVAAERLGVHQKTLRRWADIGHVPVIRLPSGYRRFSEDQIQQIAAQMGLDLEPQSDRQPPPGDPGAAL